MRAKELLHQAQMVKILISITHESKDSQELSTTSEWKVVKQ